MNRKRPELMEKLAVPILTGMIALSGCGNTQGSTNVPVEQTVNNETDITQENPSTVNKILFTPLDERKMPDGTEQKKMLEMSAVNELRFLDL